MIAKRKNKRQISCNYTTLTTLPRNYNSMKCFRSTPHALHLSGIPITELHFNEFPFQSTALTNQTDLRSLDCAHQHMDALHEGGMEEPKELLPLRCCMSEEQHSHFTWHT